MSVRNVTFPFLTALPLVLILWSTTALAQPAPDSDSNISCVERLELPRYARLAMLAQIKGNVKVSVRLSSRASVEEMTLEGHPLFKSSVETSIRRALFHANCGEKIVPLIFEFDIVRNASDDPKETVSFGAPNKFWITTEPHTPMVESSKTK